MPIPDTAAVLAANNVWKIFGPKPQAAFDMAGAGATRAEIMKATETTIAVRDVTFAVPHGETFVVMGLSGSGKSTLIRCAARLSDPTRGTILIDGEDFTAMDDDALRDIRRQKLSMVFQHFGLLPHRRVIDNVAYGLEVQGISKRDRHQRAMEVLELVGLDGWGDHYPQQLSGGMQQRVGLARALAVDPEILFFDEPFSALDPLIRRDMQDELIKLQGSMKRTLVFITHDFAEAIKLGDRIAIMRDGVFDQVGTAAELITSPATDYVREFTKDIPKAKVLCARDVMNGRIPHGDIRVAESDTVETIVPLLLSGIDEVVVVDSNDQPVGGVDRAAVAAVLGSQG